MPRILIRCDFGENIGLGHLMRCLGLGEEINSLKNPMMLLMKGPSSEIPSSVIGSGIAYGTLPETLPQEKDLFQVRRMIQASHCDTVITDGYAMGAEYLGAVKEMGVRLISFDDINPFPFPSHLVINPNLGAEKIEYQSRNGDTSFLLGTRYFVIRKALKKAVRNAGHGFSAEVKNVLITMGGSDLLGLNLKIMDAIEQVKIKARFTMLINYLVADRFAIRARAEALGEKKDFVLMDDDKILPELMAGADMAISAGGLTKYELAACGTPSIIISQAGHQDDIMREFVRTGACRYLGFGAGVEPDAIARAIEELASDLDARRGMFDKGRKLIDGRGARRIADVILKTR